MANKRLWIGILAIMLVFGMTSVGCDNGISGDSNNNYIDTLNLRTTTPSDAILSTYGLTLAQFNQIRIAAGGGYQGWAIDNDGDLVMVWTGRSQANFTNTADTLRNTHGEVDRGVYDQRLFAEGYEYWLSFFPSRYTTISGFNVSAGTMILFIYN